MKVFILGLTFIIPFSVTAQSTLESCSSSAVHFLSEISSPQEMSPDCYSLIENSQTSLTHDQSSNELVKVYAYQNILYSKVYIKDDDGNTLLDANRITAGHKTKLTNIQAIDFLEEDSKVYILNKNGVDFSVLSFSYNISGNLSPSRDLSSSELEQASNLTADHSSQKLFVISEDGAWIKSFNLKADPNGKRAENSTQVQTTVSGVASGLVAPKDICTNESEIFVLDGDKILTFNKSDNGDIAPKRVIAGENTNISNAKAISINPNGNIEITNGDGQVLVFSYDGDGNISPM